MSDNCLKSLASRSRLQVSTPHEPRCQTIQLPGYRPAFLPQKLTNGDTLIGVLRDELLRDVQFPLTRFDEVHMDSKLKMQTQQFIDMDHKCQPDRISG